MGSRPEVNSFILKMTAANAQKWSKRNENKKIHNDAFGPFAWCNRTQGSLEHQQEEQLEAYAHFIHYVAKVSRILDFIKMLLTLRIDFFSFIFSHKRRK